MAKSFRILMVCVFCVCALFFLSHSSGEEKKRQPDWYGLDFKKFYKNTESIQCTV
jgi:hypothetical protein